MATKVNWTNLALEDISNIAEFISKDSFHYAQLQTERFFARVEILETHPLSGRVVPELSKNELRELIEGSYRIVYRIVSPDRLDILTIHHASRLLSNNPLFKI